MTIKLKSNSKTTRSQASPDFEKLRAFGQKIVSVPKSAIEVHEKKNKDVGKKKV